MAKLYDLATDMKNVLDSFENFIDENGEISPEYLSKLDEVTGSVEEKAVNCALKVETLQAEISLYAEKIKRFTAEKKALERNVEWLKNYIVNNMKLAGIEKIDNPNYNAKITFRPSEKLVIAENADIPLDFMLVKNEPNKMALKEAIKGGRTFNGVTIEQCNNIQIK